MKIHAAGLCHSDLSVIDGNRPRPVPMALGHEASGVVEAVGANVTRFSNAGDDDAVAAIRDASAGGVAFAFEMAGAVPALELAYNVTRRGCGISPSRSTSPSSGARPQTPTATCRWSERP